MVELINNGRTKGLFLKGDNYYMLYYTDGKETWRSLGTKNVVEAKAKLDSSRKVLIAQGAKYRAYDPAVKSAAKPMLYVTYRKPYVVRIRGVKVGEFETAAEAIKAKKAYFRGLKK